MTKQDEISQLQNFVTLAEDAGANYLEDALRELQIHFENAIQSDFPGDLAVKNMLDHGRQLREDAERLREEISTQVSNLADLKKQAQTETMRVHRAEKRLDDLRAEIRSLANHI